MVYLRVAWMVVNLAILKVETTVHMMVGTKVEQKAGTSVAQTDQLTVGMMAEWWVVRRVGPRVASKAAWMVEWMAAEMAVMMVDL